MSKLVFCELNERCAESKNDRECSWCVFMKSGPCFKPFDLWQKCILAVNLGSTDKLQNQVDADSFIKNCGEITLALKDCVDSHPEYYGNLSQPKAAQNEEDPESVETTEVTKETEVVEETGVVEEPSDAEVPEVTEEPITESSNTPLVNAPTESESSAQKVKMLLVFKQTPKLLVFLEQIQDTTKAHKKTQKRQNPFHTSSILLGFGI